MFFKNILAKQYGSSESTTKQSKKKTTLRTEEPYNQKEQHQLVEGENPGKIYLYTTKKCDLNELVENSTNVKETATHFLVECPLCLENLGEQHQKLYVSKDFSLGFCHRCKSKFISSNVDVEGLLKTREQLIREASSTPFLLEKLSKDDLVTYEKSRGYDPKGFQYLSKRNPALTCNTSGIFSWYKNKDELLYQTLGFKFDDFKVMMPFFYNKELFYYQTRSIGTRFSKSYFCPPIQNKPVWVSPLNRGTKEVVITEGIFGAIAAQIMYNVDVISMQGSHASLYQLKMIKDCGYNVHTLYLDNSIINKNIASKMTEFNASYFRNIKFIDSMLGDPEDDFLGKSVEH